MVVIVKLSLLIDSHVATSCWIPNAQTPQSLLLKKEETDV